MHTSQLHTALKDEIDHAAAEFAEAQSLSLDGRYSGIARSARSQAWEYFGVPDFRPG